MKGLLLKEYYMIAKYCRAFLLIVVVFLAVSFFSSDNMFFIMYPAILASMIPVTLISYDEREKWNVYSGTLPYSRAQLVSAKYLAGLFFSALVFVVSALAKPIACKAWGAFRCQSTFPSSPPSSPWG